MKPYYEDTRSGITIYHGNNREILQNLSDFELALTDPPYGINRSGQNQTTCKDNRHNRKLHADYGWDLERPNREIFELVFSKSDNQIIWGGNYFTDYLPPTMGWVVWDKGQDFSTSDCELAFTSYQKALRRIVLNRGAIAREGAFHPTQKPLEVIKFCLNYSELVGGGYGHN